MLLDSILSYSSKLQLCVLSKCWTIVVCWTLGWRGSRKVTYFSLWFVCKCRSSIILWFRYTWQYIKIMQDLETWKFHIALYARITAPNVGDISFNRIIPGHRNALVIRIQHSITMYVLCACTRSCSLWNVAMDSRFHCFQVHKHMSLCILTTSRDKMVLWSLNLKLITSMLNAHFEILVHDIVVTGEHCVCIHKYLRVVSVSRCSSTWCLSVC